MSDQLNQIQIPTPCPVPWESMQGDDKVRHCAQCNCKVYDLSTIPAADGTRLLERASEGLCVQIVRRADGSVVTADAPITATTKEPDRRAFGRWVLASLATAFGLAGCREEPEVPVRLGGVVALPSDDTTRLRGEVAPPNPGQREGGKVAPLECKPTPQPESLRGRVVAPK